MEIRLENVSSIPAVDFVLRRLLRQMRPSIRIGLYPAPCGVTGTAAPHDAVASCDWHPDA
jgi:hypothetical protein